MYNVDVFLVLIIAFHAHANTKHVQRGHQTLQERGGGGGGSRVLDTTKKTPSETVLKIISEGYYYYYNISHQSFYLQKGKKNHHGY